MARRRRRKQEPQLGFFATLAAIVIAIGFAAWYIPWAWNRTVNQDFSKLFGG